MSVSSSSGVWSRSSSCNPFFSPQISRNVEPLDFANVEDMLFEVFRCEETDTIDSISISQFLKVSYTLSEPNIPVSVLHFLGIYTLSDPVSSLDHSDSRTFVPLMGIEFVFPFSFGPLYTF